MAKNATKITLGKRPDHFKTEVQCALLEGGTGCMEVKYKYRTRTELAELTDELQAKLKDEANAELERFNAALTKAKDAGEKLPEFGITQTEIVKREAALNVEYIMKIVDGWNLDQDFDAEAVAELVDTLPAMAQAVKDKYRAAINEGRLGN